MARRPAWVRVAVLTVLVGGCAAEDSVQPNYIGASGSGGAGSTSGSGGAVAGMGGSGGVAAGTGGGGAAGVGGMTGGVGGNVSGGEGGTMAGTGSGGMSGMGSGGTSGPGTAQDADCDMNGLWATRMLTITDALDLDQCASIYSFYELKHEGANVEVVNHFNCGIYAKGTGNTDFKMTTREAFLNINRQIGRKGTLTKGADGTCQLDMEPYWAAWGVDETFLPAERNSSETLQQMQSMKPLPTDPGAAGVVDVEGDGKPGLAFVVSGSPADGTRHGAQRNVQTWKTDDFYKITPSTDWANDIEARAAFHGEEVALDVEPAENIFLYTIASPAPNADAARATLRFLGRDASDPRAQAVIVSTDPADVAGALATCANIVAALEVISPVPNHTPQRCPCPSGMPSDQQRTCAP